MNIVIYIVGVSIIMFLYVVVIETISSFAVSRVRSVKPYNEVVAMLNIWGKLYR